MKQENPTVPETTEFFRKMMTLYREMTAYMPGLLFPDFKQEDGIHEFARGGISPHQEHCLAGTITDEDNISKKKTPAYPLRFRPRQLRAEVLCMYPWDYMQPVSSPLENHFWGKFAVPWKREIILSVRFNVTVACITGMESPEHETSPIIVVVHNPVLRGYGGCRRCDSL